MKLTQMMNTIVQYFNTKKQKNRKFYKIKLNSISLKKFILMISMDFYTVQEQMNF